MAGAGPAVATAVGAFLLYDFLFIDPRFTFTVDDPQEWLNLLLLLVVGIVVGRLAGRERDRAETAIAREREALAMFRLSFALASATADHVPPIPAILDVILDDAVGARRAWIEVARSGRRGHAGPGPAPASAVQHVLGRRPGDEPAEWTRVHAPTAPAGRPTAGSATRRAGASSPGSSSRAGDRTLGSIWLDAVARSQGVPGRGRDAGARRGGRPDRRVARARPARSADATAAEIARRSDALKSALLDSVSHDLRTPLASIRAAAGT